MQHVSQMQMQAGAAGLTVAKVGEGEVMRPMCDDLLIAYPTLDTYRAHQVAPLAQHGSVTVGVDSELAVERLSDAAQAAGVEIGILVDLDVGFHRTGVQSPELALCLAKSADQAPGLILKGIMYFPGHVYGTDEQIATLLKGIDEQLGEARGLWQQHGLNCEIISGGSTPTAYHSHLTRNTNEIRPGTYVYNDANCINFGVADVQECAARIITTVVSDAVVGQVVLDAGSKTLTSDKNAVSPDSGHGYLIDYPAAQVHRLSEEHGQTDVSACVKQPKLGERVVLIPNHICPCVNLQERIWWKEGDKLTAMPVDARGLLV